MDDRHLLAEKWLKKFGKAYDGELALLSGDASFRRYFRLKTNEKSYILMDAPPTKEDAGHFAKLAHLFESQGMRIPHVFEKDEQQGFLLLSDFGDQQLFGCLTSVSVDRYYQQAIVLLCRWQSMGFSNTLAIPQFDDDLYQHELSLFFDWFLPKYCHVMMTDAEKKSFQDCYQLLVNDGKSQPQVLVHRDYHSRNLMVCDDGELGILDFQDAVWGPITYDLVSLLKDCYIAWDPNQIKQWVQFYMNHYDGDQLVDVSFETFLKWFHWAGLQRHIKCLGIFSRLAYRDHKKGYLQDIPRVLNYVLQVCGDHKELTWLYQFMKRVTHESNDFSSRSRYTNATVDRKSG